MVRLKDNIINTTTNISAEFQFLMVRLKDTTQDFLPDSTRLISIPYGAIKSKLKFLAFCENIYFNSLWCD